MISVVKLYEVKNTSTDTVAKGGYIFPPRTTVKVRVSEYKIKEFSAHKDLKVKEVSSSDKQHGERKNETSKYRINGNGRLQCPYCDKDYKTEEGLDKHIEEKHPEKKQGDA
ncbi:hypothetical protein SAMN04489735_100254 [Aneurinibacillus thermoaerophilus]|uniref:C2H2-type domain-containing protein n=1 Tax=Aneurinibacillus thermoaerophilus TaxID=143495 RepID=A0A1G7WS10_ANETH|nr:hypothetical protein [Aneurinibacillus thermoaerophilus]SDG74000.1 hypothetical protein SAMN04489735_100254 [Aneurinibacillus thermoaerophilus]